MRTRIKAVGMSMLIMLLVAVSVCCSHVAASIDLPPTQHELKIHEYTIEAPDIEFTKQEIASTEEESIEEILTVVEATPYASKADPVETKLPVEPIVDWIESTVNTETTEPEPEPQVSEPAAEIEAEILTDTGEWTHSGNFRITHYCNCSICCGKWAGGPTASGVMPSAGRTVAVDKSVIPLGSEVLINGQIYIAEDTGVSGCWIDIFCDSHQEAKNRGSYYTDISWR